MTGSRSACWSISLTVNVGKQSTFSTLHCCSTNSLPAVTHTHTHTRQSTGGHFTCSYTHRHHTFSVSFKQPDSVELLGVDETEPLQVVLLATPMYKLYCSCVEHTTNSAAKNVKIKFQKFLLFTSKTEIKMLLISDRFRVCELCCQLKGTL